MTTSPDSALHLLQQLKIGLFSSRADKAYYALLYSEALDKNDKKIESDSMISIATDYYGASDPELAGYAWFYSSRCAANRGDAKAQADALMKAQEFIASTTYFKLKGLLYSDKAGFYKSQQSYDSASRYNKLAATNFLNSSDTVNYILSLLNTGDNYLYLSRFDSAIYYFKKAEITVRSINNPLLTSTVNRSLGTTYSQLNEYQKAISYLKNSPETNINYYDSNKNLLIADVFIRNNKTDSAAFYLKKVYEGKDNNSYYSKLWLKIYELKGDKDKALYYSKRITTINDSLYKRKLDVSFAGLETKYNFQKIKIANQQLTISKKQTSILLLMTLVFLSFGIVIFLVWRNRIKNSQLATKEKLIEHEKKQVEHEKKLLENEIATNHLLEQQIKMQNIILRNVDQYRKNALKKPENTFSISPIQNENFYEELIACMDLEYNNISKRLVAAYPELTRNDQLICCLLLANFDTGMMASVLHVKLESMNKQRYRLRTKLGLENSDNLLEHLKHF